MTLEIKAIATSHDIPVMAMPSAVPAAGGCSISTTTINNIESPTARAYTEIEDSQCTWGMRAQTEPKNRPIAWPPMTFLDFAVIEPGIVKTIKAVAPIDSVTTAFSRLKKRRIMKIVRVARKLWNR